MTPSWMTKLNHSGNCRWSLRVALWSKYRGRLNMKNILLVDDDVPRFEELQKSGISGVIQKPFDPVSLPVEVKEIYEREIIDRCVA